ncbi:hypothetical protein [Glycomyces sp. NPDC021274]|uniref:hypothetical protein n=1 Tax=Glycomyces sp. NPDC021274 TaxID=3155120 RepID=UPI00341079B7
MSIDGRGPSLNRSADNTIAALKSKNGRLEERITVLEGVAKANADDRDSYMEQTAELEGERDRARGIAVEFEQRVSRVQQLHQPFPEPVQGYLPDGSYGYIDPACQMCGTPDEYGAPWPCATYKAATGTDLEGAA